MALRNMYFDFDPPSHLAEIIVYFNWNALLIQTGPDVIGLGNQLLELLSICLTALLCLGVWIMHSRHNSAVI